MLVVAAMHASNDDIALDQRIVHVPPSPARPGAGRTDPPQFLRFGEEFWRHGPVRRFGRLNVGKSVSGIGVYLGDSTRDGSADFPRPRRVGIRRQQQDCEAHRAAPAGSLGGLGDLTNMMQRPPTRLFVVSRFAVAGGRATAAADAGRTPNLPVNVTESITSAIVRKVFKANVRIRVSLAHQGG